MSRKDLKQSVTVDLEGNLPQRSKAYEKALVRMAKRGQRHMSGLSRTASLAGRGLDRLGNRYSAILSGAGFAYAVKQVGDLEERYTRLGNKANISAEKTESLKNAVFDVSRAADIRINPDQMIGAIEAIVEKTGDLKFAEANLRNIGLAIQATGAGGKDIGELLAEFQKQGIFNPDDVLKALDTLNQQGKAGAFTLENLASLGPRVVAAYTGQGGRSGVQAMREMGAALQVIRQGTGSSEQAATAFEAVMRTLIDPKKIKQLKELGGINVFDPEKLKKGEQELRPINELMVEIIKAARGRQTNLAAVFDAEAMRAFNSAAAEYKRTGSVESLDKFMSVVGDGSATINDSTRAAKTFNAAVTSLAAAWSEFADDNLSEPIRELADWLNSLDKETVDNWMEVGKWVAIIGGSAVAGKKLGVGRLAGRLLSGKGVRNAGLGAGSTGPVPVFVVNNGIGGAAGRMGRVGGKLAKVGKAAGAAGLLYGAYEIGDIIGTAINDNFVENTKFGSWLGEATNQIAAFLGSEESRRAIEINERAERQKNAKQEASVKVEIVGNTPVRVREMKAEGMDLDVDAGPSMGPIS